MTSTWNSGMREIPSMNRNATPEQPIKPVSSTQRPSLYERGLRQRAERQHKLNTMEYKFLMEECTFTPKTSRTSRTSAISTPSSEESVFDRLYKTKTTPSTHGSDHSTPRASNRLRSPPDLHRQSGRPSSSISSHIDGSCYSSRVEQLYENGVRKMRARPKNNTKEKQMREQRMYNEQVAECTFRPAVGKKAKRKSKLVMEPRNRRPPSALPLEIVVSGHAWTTPQRRGDQRIARAVSPLRDDPSFVGGGGASVAKTMATEYGSI